MERSYQELASRIRAKDEWAPQQRKGKTSER